MAPTEDRHSQTGIGSLVVSPDGKWLYAVSFASAYTLLKIDLQSQDSSGNHTFKSYVIAGQYGRAGNVSGSGTSAKLGDIFGMAINHNGTALYLADVKYDNIRKVELSGTDKSKVYPYVSVVAGSPNGKHYEGFAEGEGTTAKFNDPRDIAYRRSGSREYLYVTDAENQRIRYIELSYRNRVTTFVTKTTYNKYCAGKEQILHVGNEVLLWTTLPNNIYSRSSLCIQWLHAKQILLCCW